jgi:flagellar basal-body rod protein FlgB
MFTGLGNFGRDFSTYLDLLSLRQKLTAANIANADTPGYKTRDIDFHAAFASALHNGAPPEIVELSGLESKNDGNNVSLDREARMLAENALRFRIGAQLLKSELEDVKKAIRES